MRCKLTIQQPGSAGTPSRADAHEVHREQASGIVGEKGGGVSFTTHGDDVVVPAHPEATELSGVQDARSGHLGHLGLLAILADHRLGVLPSSQEDLEDGAVLLGSGCEGQMGILGRTHLEGEHSSAGREELVLQLIGGVDFCKKDVEEKISLRFHG